MPRLFYFVGRDDSAPAKPRVLIRQKTYLIQVRTYFLPAMRLSIDPIPQCEKPERMLQER
jgi:hypothetical protein